ncbi:MULTISPECIES: hypothetical protein [unclassified Mycobacterium]|uniref:hypothetical protein n=1 Tax=unclassified Mycobacterium TaxID=2642494 RepID=UPI0008002B4B|nr:MULTISPECIES: hypothetical protein [unclassified Mycobacterium]OBG77136.1 hypothetical protein A5700_20605 [Mycobacterium sp. E1214]OBH25461.1 hypothetical protein A5693_00550 [Mycobacterium sp. E1319]
MSMTTNNNRRIDFEPMSDRDLAVTLLELAYELERRHGTENANRRLAQCNGTSIDELERWVVDELDRAA